MLFPKNDECLSSQCLYYLYPLQTRHTKTTFSEGYWKRFGSSTYAVQTGCPWFVFCAEDNNKECIHEYDASKGDARDDVEVVEAKEHSLALRMQATSIAWP